MSQPVVVSYGLGVDSTAMLVGMVDRGWRPDLILFANVGDEWPATYMYIPIIREYLRQNSFPDITVVRYVPKRFKHGKYHTLEGNCLVNKTLPSLAFGRKSCSLKWKAAPMDKFVDTYEPFQEHVRGGGKIERLIGYDDGPKDAKRGATRPDPKYIYRYPLREWGWDRDRCKQEIRGVGLPVPVKSACFYCPSMQKHELIHLAVKHPDLALRAVQMEDTARPNLIAIEGLWRNGVKGTRKPESKRPGSWRKFLEDEGLMEHVQTAGPGTDSYKLDAEDIYVEEDYGRGPELCRGGCRGRKRRMEQKHGEIRDILGS
jgi:hypothetical protein